MSKQRFLLFMISLLWLTAVIGGYYVSHKPITPQIVLAWLSHGWSLLAALMWLSLAGGLGARLYPASDTPPLTRLALQVAVGLGVWSVIALIWSGLIGINLGWALGMISLGGALLWRDVISWWRNWAALPPFWREAGSLGRGIALGVGLIFLFTLPVALAPPLKFDALVYHLSLPQETLLTGRLVYDPANMFWGMPQAAQMGYLLAMALGGAPAAAALGWLVGLTAVIGLLGFSSTRFGRRAGWVTVAALLGGYSLAASLSWAYVDWHTILFGFSALALLECCLAADDSRTLWLAGIFAGLAIGTKYTAGVVWLGGAVVLATAGKPSRFKLLLIFTLGAALAVFPWLSKNLAATGNPFYPFGYPAGAMTPLRLSLYQQQPIEGGWLDFFLLPLRATFYGVENATLLGRPGYNSSLGPLLLGLAPLALLWRGKAKEWGFVRRVGLFSLVGWIVWGLGGRFYGHLIRTHLYFAIFPALALLAGAGFAALGNLRLPGVRTARLGGALVWLALGFNLVQIGEETLERRAWEVLLGTRTPEQYQIDNLGWYAPAMEAVRDLPEGKRALLLWEPRGFYCAPRCDPDETLDHWMDALRTFGSATAVLDDWRARGYTHLLFYDLGVEFIRASDSRYQLSEWIALDGILADLPAVERFGEGYTLYALESP